MSRRKYTPRLFIVGYRPGFEAADAVQVPPYVTSPEFELAFHMMERWGPIVGAPDGEDSAGRAKIRTMTPAETAERALDLSTELYRQALKRGFVVPSDTSAVHATLGLKTPEEVAEVRKTRTRQGRYDRDTRSSQSTSTDA